MYFTIFSDAVVLSVYKKKKQLSVRAVSCTHITGQTSLALWGPCSVWNEESLPRYWYRIQTRLWEGSVAHDYHWIRQTLIWYQPCYTRYHTRVDQIIKHTCVILISKFDCLSSPFCTILYHSAPFCTILPKHFFFHTKHTVFRIVLIEPESTRPHVCQMPNELWNQPIPVKRTLFP